MSSRPAPPHAPWRGQGGRTVPARPAVLPVQGEEPRPRWSVLVPVYECARYLEETLRGVLEQDPGPEHMQIVVLDDCSVRDDPEAVVRRVAGDRVCFLRNERNLGHVRTFNRLLGLARGEWVHLLHGDDLVRQGFYAMVDRAAQGRDDLAAVQSGYVHLQDGSDHTWPGPKPAETAGVLSEWPARLGVRQRLQAPSIAVRRRTYEQVGGFDEQVAGYGEDWEMWVRVSAAGPVWYDPAELAVYRVREGSLSDPSRLGSNVRDMRRVIDLNAQTLAAVLPPSEVSRVTTAARHDLVATLLRRGRRALHAGHLRSAVAHAAQVAVVRPGLGALVPAAGLLAETALRSPALAGVPVRVARRLRGSFPRPSADGGGTPTTSR